MQYSWVTVFFKYKYVLYLCIFSPMYIIYSYRTNIPHSVAIYVFIYSFILYHLQKGKDARVDTPGLFAGHFEGLKFN